MNELLLVILLAAFIIALILILRPVHDAVRDLTGKVMEASGTIRADLGKEVRDARALVEQIRTDYSARRLLDEELRAATLRIEAVVTGHQASGLAGEHILAASLKQFPAGMIDQDFRIDGKVVEYALVLPNGKRLAIDSKWVGGALLERLAGLPVGPEREEVADEIERLLQKRVKEAAQYINPSLTLPWAVAAVPDAAYALCRKAHVEGYRAGVILVPYSLVVPYLLTLYRLQLQYVHAVDEERLENTLAQAERALESLDRLLDNSVARGATMIQNAYSESQKLVGILRGALSGLRATPEAEPTASPGEGAETTKETDTRQED